jgi:hypothetical protein
MVFDLTQQLINNTTIPNPWLKTLVSALGCWKLTRAGIARIGQSQSRPYAARQDSCLTSGQPAEPTDYLYHHGCEYRQENLPGDELWTFCGRSGNVEENFQRRVACCGTYIQSSERWGRLCNSRISTLEAFFTSTS